MDAHETGREAGTGRPPSLTAGEATAARVVAALAAVLGLVGFANSFAAVQEAVAPSFGWWAWSAPLGVDVGIAIFTATDILHARLDMRTRWLRAVPWALVGVTVYLNVAPQPTPLGKVAHATLPLVWVVAVEVGAHTVRRHAQLTSPTRMERVRRARWLLAPLPTAVMWRRMVLWETRSYAAALDRERSRLLAQASLREAYGGRKWRWKAPHRVRVLYRLGEIAPGPSGEVHAALEPAAPAAPVPAPAPHRTAVPASRTPAPRTGTGAGTGRVRLAELVSKVPADDPRSNTALADEFAAECGLSPNTARRYVGELKAAK